MSSRVRRRFLRFVPSGALLTAILGVGLLWTLAEPVAVVSQETQERVSESELEYRSARSAHEAALDARAAAEQRFDRALQEIRAAQQEDDEDRLRAAYAQAQDQALQLQSLEQRVRRTKERVEATREDLVAALDARVESLMTELSQTESRAEREELGALIRDLTFRIREVEEEGTVGEETRLVGVPEVSWDPRDGVVELRWKADLLERRARQYEERIAEIEAQMEDLRRRQRRNRSLDDLLTGIQRFDDDQVPVVSPSDEAEARSESVDQSQQQEDDTSRTAPREMTLQERLERLELLRSRVERFREEVLFRARQFRDRAEEISS